MKLQIMLGKKNTFLKMKICALKVWFEKKKMLWAAWWSISNV